MATTVTVSERAARRIGEILIAEAPGTMLRVSVEGGGCSGFQYRFDMERSQAPDDFVIARDGATVLIDPISLRYMEGAEIDFVDDLIGASFKIANPNATASCGCGTSFSVGNTPAPRLAAQEPTTSVRVGGATDLCGPRHEAYRASWMVRRRRREHACCVRTSRQRRENRWCRVRRVPCSGRHDPGGVTRCTASWRKPAHP